MSDNVFNDQVDLFCNELWKEMQQKFPLEKPLENKEKRNQLIELGKEIEGKRGTREAIYLSQKYNELSNQLGTNDNPLTSDNVYIHGANENLIYLVDTIKEVNSNNAPTDIYEWTANICDKMENSEASQEFKRFVTEFAGKENVETMFPRPEPVIEEKKEFSTTSKDHKVRIEQWMEHVGLGDKSQELIDKYGLDNAYAIVQNSMKAPANMTKATDGKFRGSKGTINYFLENDVERDRLIQIPGMDLKTVHESLVSVGKAKKIETPNTTPKLNIEAPEVVLPEKIDAIPMYNLSELDMQKVKYTAAMLDELKLDGIRDKKIDKEIMHAFEKAMENDAPDIKTWSGNFRFHLIDELNLEGRAYGYSKDEYSKLILPLVEGSDKIVEKLDSLPNDNPRYADLVASVNKFNTKNDMKSQKGEIVQNADNQEKVEKVETKVSRREKFKAGYNRVLAFVGLKKKEKADSDVNPENSATQTVETQTIDLTLLGDALKSKDAGK